MPALALTFTRSITCPTRCLKLTLDLFRVGISHKDFRPVGHGTGSFFTPTTIEPGSVGQYLSKTSPPSPAGNARLCQETERRGRFNKYLAWVASLGSPLSRNRREGGKGVMRSGCFAVLSLMGVTAEGQPPFDICGPRKPQLAERILPAHNWDNHESQFDSGRVH